jgi:hypothetical protein
MGFQSVSEIIETATDAQVRAWYKAICDNHWPADMPVPCEACESIWHKLQKAYMSLPIVKGNK